jgi:hypothetical protein
MANSKDKKEISILIPNDILPDLYVLAAKYQKTVNSFISDVITEKIKNLKNEPTSKKEVGIE